TNYSSVVTGFLLRGLCYSCGIWGASDTPTPQENPVPAPVRPASAVLAAVLAVAALAPSGRAETSPVPPALAQGAGATSIARAVAPHPVDPAVSTYRVAGVSRVGL